ncbi:MAG: glycosyltransferase family 39 protein [Candidatus Hydrogenedentota bacterium]
MPLVEAEIAAPAGRSRAASGRQHLALWIACIVLSLPFCSRPYYVDDHYHVTMAEGLLHDPARPYDFRSDDTMEDAAGWVSGEPPRMVNPPVMHYFLAAAMALFGSDESRLRLVYLIFPLISISGILALARRLCSRPVWAAWLALVCPVFWLNSSSLLIDMAILPFAVWGLELFLRGWEKDGSGLSLWAGSALLGLAPLVKYTAYPFLLLAPAWVWIEDPCFRSRIGKLKCMIAPLLISLAWCLWTAALYGEPHITAAWKRPLSGVLWIKTFSGFSFLGGATGFALAFLPLAALRHPRVAFSFGSFAVVLAYFYTTPLGGFSADPAILLSLFQSSALVMLALFLILRRNLNRMAQIWMWGYLLLLHVPMPWLAARYYLVLIPPLACLAVDSVRFSFASERPFRFVMVLLIVGTGSLSAVLATEERIEAETQSRIAEDVARDPIISAETGGKRFVGDSFFGFNHYLRRKGWTPVWNQADLRPGDLVLSPTNSIPATIRRGWTLPTETIREFRYDSPLPVRLNSLECGAAFYASAGGAFPYAFSTRPTEVFVVMKVLEPR